MSGLIVGSDVDALLGVRVAGPGRALMPDTEPVDVFLADGRIQDIAPAGRLPAPSRSLDLAGCWVMSGLWDHHVHVTQWALGARRLRLDDTVSAHDAAARMTTAPVLTEGRRVGTGFRDALWEQRPSLDLLDEITGATPTYLINADVHSVWLNTAAFVREGMTPTADGVLRELPAFEISRRLNAADARAADDAVDAAGRAAAARGVVGIVDLDLAWNAEAWQSRVAAGYTHQRVQFGIYPEYLERALAEGLHTGMEVDSGYPGLLRVGRLKVIADGSLGTRTAACSHPYRDDPARFGAMTVGRAELTELLMRAMSGGIEASIHAIGDVANAEVLDAFAQSGATGTIEHAQLVAAVDLPRFARLGVAASVQPAHAVDDRDIVDRLWADQTAVCYPLQSLAAAGANLLFGSDAPVSALDPWEAIAAAVSRTRDARPPFGAAERFGIAAALAASTRDGSAVPTELVPGADADLVVCAADPETADADALRAMPVAATLVGGRLTHLD